MYRLSLLASLLPLVACQSAPAGPGVILPEKMSKTTILLGTRQLAEEDWAPVEDHLLLGAESSSTSTASNFGHEVGLGISSSHDFPDFIAARSQFIELYAGGRFQKTTGNARPFVGAGAALTHGRFEALLGAAGSVNTTVIGGYVHAGVAVRASETLDIVFDVRKRFGSDGDFNGTDLDMDYLTLAIGLSF